MQAPNITRNDAVQLYVERQGSLTLTGQGTKGPVFGSASRLFTRDGRAYVLESGLSIYRLP